MTTCESIAGQLGELFTCAPHGQYVRVRTPFLYPDGDVVDVYVRAEGNKVVVSDLGESLRWLRNQTLAQKKTSKQRQLIEDVCVTHRVDLFKGVLLTRAPSMELADAVIRVGQAALRVADVWFTLRNRTVQSITDEVADYLGEQASLKFERGVKRAGRSGKTWAIDFHVWAPNRTSFVNVLSTGNRGTARGIAEHVLATWYDLSHLPKQDTALVSLFDDTLDVWSPEDFKLLEDISSIARWSRPDEFAGMLQAN